MPAPSRPQAPRLALSVTEAAESIGLGRRAFQESVMPYLRVVQVGSRKLIPVAELERWLVESSR